MNNATEFSLVCGALLFGMGMLGLLTRRSLIMIFLSLEMMLMGVIINLVTYAQLHGSVQGQVMAIMVLTVAACEAALVLAMSVGLYRRRGTLDVNTFSDLGESPAVVEPAAPLDDEPEHELPKLVPSGLDPNVSLQPSRLPNDRMNQVNSQTESYEHV